MKVVLCALSSFVVTLPVAGFAATSNLISQCSASLFQDKVSFTSDSTAALSYLNLNDTSENSQSNSNAAVSAIIYDIPISFGTSDAQNFSRTVASKLKINYTKEDFTQYYATYLDQAGVGAFKECLQRSVLNNDIYVEVQDITPSGADVILHFSGNQEGEKYTMEAKFGPDGDDPATYKPLPNIVGHWSDKIAQRQGTTIPFNTLNLKSVRVIVNIKDTHNGNQKGDVVLIPRPIRFRTDVKLVQDATTKYSGEQCGTTPKTASPVSLPQNGSHFADIQAADFYYYTEKQDLKIGLGFYAGASNGSSSYGPLNQSISAFAVCQSSHTDDPSAQFEEGVSAILHLVTFTVLPPGQTPFGNLKVDALQQSLAVK